MRYVILSMLLGPLLTAPALPVAPRPAATGVNCDGFGYVCGQTLPLCGCGCLPAADACMKDAKDGGLVASCVDANGARGYCAQ